MRIVFITNYLNHYQMAFAEAAHRAGIDYWIVSCDGEVPQDRKKLGFIDEFDDISYLLYLDKDNKKIIELIDNSEIVMTSYRGLDLIRERARSGKICFLVSERIFKTEKDNFIDKAKQILRLYKYKLILGNYIKRKNIFYLLIGDYSVSDHIKIGVDPNRIMRFAYFPENGILEERDYLKGNIRFIWVGRFVDWKRPDHAVRVVKELIDEGFDVTLKMVGTGEMENELKQMAYGYPIEFTGGVPAKDIRKLFNESDLMLFTSNYGEGWGCVLNEAMSEGCAVVASIMAGSTPSLIKDGVNGLVYDGTYDDLKKKVKSLMITPSDIEKYGKEAKKTIDEKWNGDIAITNLIKQYNQILQKKSLLLLNGPCGASSEDSSFFESV